MCDITPAFHPAPATAIMDATAARAAQPPQVAPEFDFKGQKVRVVEIEGNPWFVAVDVCRALDIHVRQNGEVNASNALRPLSADEVTTSPMGGRGCPPKLISESGLYKLIMRSDKPEAKAFQDWVTREVLPTIKKTGAYGVGSMPKARFITFVVARNLATSPP